MKKRVLVLATVFVFVLAGILYAEEPGSIDGFRDYAWGTSFEEVSKDLENEFGIDGFNTEEFDEEEQTEENGIKNPTKYSIHIAQCSVAGYDAEAFLGFDEVGLLSGNYKLKLTDYEISIRPVYNELLSKYSTVYGEPLQVGEAERGYGAIWRDQEKNIVFMDAYDGNSSKSFDIIYWANDFPVLDLVDREMGESFEDSCGINLYNVLNAENYEGI